MRIASLPFGTVDWNALEPTRHPGTTGEALWRTRQFGEVRVRMVDYSAGYVADPWCTKGHFLLCIAGELDTELGDGRCVRLTPGMSYHAADGAEPHRSSTAVGARLYVVD